MPALFICHGGGPLPLMNPPMGGPALTEHLRAISKQPPAKPSAIIVVSAHWEESPLAITSSSKPPMHFDYYGFPPDMYELAYSAPGKPELARQVQSLLIAAGHPCRLDEERGFDHGVFVPLMLAYPNADVPVVCLSLHSSLDAKQHLSIGRALAPLRDEGVLLLGSGISFHNMRAFDMSGQGKSRSAVPTGAAFDAALVAAVTDPDARDAALCDWVEMPDARQCHPREEHLLPLMVVAGSAAKREAATRNFADTYLGVAVSGFRFG